MWGTEIASVHYKIKGIQGLESLKVPRGCSEEEIRGHMLEYLSDTIFKENSFSLSDIEMFDLVGRKIISSTDYTIVDSQIRNTTH